MGYPVPHQDSVRQTVLFVVLVCCAVALLSVSQPSLRRASLKAGCRSNLQQLGNYLTLYVNRYGNDLDYPSTSVIAGTGAPIPEGPNGRFWSVLYRVPSQSTAVSQRPGDDSIYVCRVFHLGRDMRTTTLEYTGPAFSAVWPEGSGSRQEPMYPGGRLSDAVRGDVMIGGDVVGPPDSPNHGGQPGRPADDWEALGFDGQILTIHPGTKGQSIYAAATTGGRTT